MGKQDMKKYNMDYVRISKSPCMNEIGKKKYGFDERGEKTYSEVGRELNLSRQRVHQIEQKALSKLSTDSSLKK